MTLEASEAAALDSLLNTEEAELLTLESEAEFVMVAEALDRLAAMDEESLAREDESDDVRLDSAEVAEEMTLDADEVGALLAAAAVPPALVASGYAPL